MIQATHVGNYDTARRHRGSTEGALRQASRWNGKMIPPPLELVYSYSAVRSCAMMAVVRIISGVLFLVVHLLYVRELVEKRRGRETADNTLPTYK